MVQQAFGKIVEKSSNLFSNVWGWIITLFVGFVNFLGDEKTAFLVVFIAIGFDLIWGMAAAVKRGEYILSEAIRETFTKTFAYGSVLVLVLLIEKLTHDGTFIATRVMCVIAASCELWSVCANILIVKPDFPFIRLFRKYLAGEISKKLNITTEEYNELMQERRARKKNKNKEENEQRT